MSDFNENTVDLWDVTYPALRSVWRASRTPMPRTCIRAGGPKTAVTCSCMTSWTSRTAASTPRYASSTSPTSRIRLLAAIVGWTDTRDRSQRLRQGQSLLHLQLLRRAHGTRLSRIRRAVAHRLLRHLPASSAHEFRRRLGRLSVLRQRHDSGGRHQQRPVPAAKRHACDAAWFFP